MESIQQALAVFFVLGLLAGTLYLARSRGLARFRFKGIGRAGTRHMQSIERLPLTAQHSLHLVSVNRRVLLIAVSPGGCTVVDGHDWGVPADDSGVRP
jgi:flagellar biogenesis protein FliO